MILFYFWIEFVKFNLYHEMDEMVYAYTYQYGYFVVDFRRNGKWYIGEMKLMYGILFKKKPD